MSRPGLVPILAAGGGLALLVSLFLDWYAPGISAFTAFEVLDLVLAALALAALAPGVAALVGSLTDVAANVDLSALARALPAVAGLALLIVVSQALNHPPAAVGEEARAGQWIALAGSALLAGAAAVGSRAAVPSPSRRVAPSPREAAHREGSPSRPEADAAPRAVRATSAPAEARAAEPAVMGELYPNVERKGPIGGDDPGIARAEPPENGSATSRS